MVDKVSTRLYHFCCRAVINSWSRTMDWRFCTSDLSSQSYALCRSSISTRAFFSNAGKVIFGLKLFFGFVECRCETISLLKKPQITVYPSTPPSIECYKPFAVCIKFKVKTLSALIFVWQCSSPMFHRIIFFSPLELLKKKDLQTQVTWTKKTVNVLLFDDVNVHGHQHANSSVTDCLQSQRRSWWKCSWIIVGWAAQNECCRTKAWRMEECKMDFEAQEWTPLFVPFKAVIDWFDEHMRDATQQCYSEGLLYPNYAWKLVLFAHPKQMLDFH